MKKILFFMMAMLPLMFSGCSDDDEGGDRNVNPLPPIEDISLNYHTSEQTISLQRDVKSEGANVSLKDGSFWITRLKLEGNEISFEVLENQDTEKGHRYDTILIENKGIRIGSICVSQARKPISSKRLLWAMSNAMYRNEALFKDRASGLEITKAIYNLEKTTNGRDSYKNYPAFAYCIEMNHNPEKNMEWHLPTEEEMRSYANGQSFAGTPIIEHNYWWTASENGLNGNAYNLYSKSFGSRGAVSKGEDWWVMAFRNGKLEE